MKYLLNILSLIVLIASFHACKDDNDTDIWREKNLNAYEAVTKNPDFHALQTETGPSGVYYKIIKTGTGTEYPLQTSNVKVLYKGTYYDGTVFDYGSSLNEIPVEFSLAGQNLIRGFSFALQQMVVGDRWEIWIPYFLGYGANGYYDSYSYQLIVKGYTTLIFEVELVSITQYPL